MICAKSINRIPVSVNIWYLILTDTLGYIQIFLLFAENLLDLMSFSLIALSAFALRRERKVTLTNAAWEWSWCDIVWALTLISFSRLFSSSYCCCMRTLSIARFFSSFSSAIRTRSRSSAFFLFLSSICLNKLTSWQNKTDAVTFIMKSFPKEHCKACSTMLNECSKSL